MMPGARYLLAVVLSAAGCDGCHDDAAPDAREVDAPVDAEIDATPPRCDPSKPFGSIRALDEFNTLDMEDAAALTEDELTLYFGRRVGTADWDVYEATRPTRTSRWGMPVKSSASTSMNERAPAISNDGLALFMMREMGTPADRSDIVVSRRASTSDPFPAPTVEPTLYSGSFDGPLKIRSDNVLLFSSYRTLTFRVYGSTWDGSVASTPNVWPEQDGLVLSGDLLTVYYQKVPASGPARIWLATRSTPTGPFSNARMLDEIASDQGDAPMWVSRDNCVLYFTRALINVNVVQFDLYVATKPL